MKVSFFLPTRDRPRMLPKMVASVLCQSDPRWELVVFDNGEMPVENLMPRDPRCYYWRGKANGPADAHQQALTRTTGDIVMPLSDDDTIDEDTVAIIFERLGDAEWGYGRTAFMVDGNIHHLLGGHWDYEELKQSYYLGGAVFWRRRLFEKVGGFDSEYNSAADWDLYLRFGAVAEPVYVKDKILYYYNDWPGTDSHQMSWRQHESNVKIVEKYNK